MEEVQISLRATAPRLDPDEISAAVGVDATTTYRSGDLVTSRRPDVRRKHGLWLLSLDRCDADNFSSKLRELIDKIPDGVLVNDEESGMEVDMFIGLFGVRNQSGLTIDPDVLLELGRRGWYVIFDMYVAG